MNATYYWENSSAHSRCCVLAASFALNFYSSFQQLVLWVVSVPLPTFARRLQLTLLEMWHGDKRTCSLSNSSFYFLSALLSERPRARINTVISVVRQVILIPGRGKGVNTAFTPEAGIKLLCRSSLQLIDIPPHIASSPRSAPRVSAVLYSRLEFAVWW